jgi:hypothetical protein
MRFKDRLECEVKTRREFAHDYSAAVTALAQNWGRVVPIGGPYPMLDTYFDTADGCLLKEDHRFRVRYRPNRCPRYCYKRLVERDTYLVVSREITARVRDHALDLGNYLHQRLPVLSHLVSFLEAGDGRNRSGMHTFVPRVQVRTVRTSYAIVGDDGGPALFALIDRATCLPWRADAARSSGRQFSELEVELPISKVSPGSLEFLRSSTEKLAELGYFPVCDSKYVHACQLWGAVCLGFRGGVVGARGQGC